MTDQDLQLNIGDALQLQFVSDENNRRHASRVIGYLPGKSVLVTTPVIDGKYMLVREGQMVVIRMLSGKNVYGFSTSILRACIKPYAYLHLKYPQEMEKIVVRQALRAKAELLVSVFKEGADISDMSQATAGVIVDISTAGALLRAKEQLGVAEELIQITTRVELAQVKEYLTLMAVIRNVRIESNPEGTDTTYFHGLEFKFLEPKDSITLHAFVYEQILHNK